eukprot:2025158-Pyramimonas_sp.AAC.1
METRGGEGSADSDGDGEGLLTDTLPKVTWTGLCNFPWNEPAKFDFVDDLLDAAMPMCYGYGDPGVFPRTPSSQDSRPIRRRRHGYILVPDQLDT